MTTSQTDPHRPGANLVLPPPPQPPRAFAYRAPPRTDPLVASAIPAALAARGVAVLALDLGPARPPGDSTWTEESDAAAVLQAADRLRTSHSAAALLIGHSWAGPPILAAASSLTDVRAVVTIGSPAPFSLRLRGAPLLVLHAPLDPVVSAQEASRVFAAARHPKSFIALDGVDHTVTEKHSAHHIAGLIVAWAEPYLPISHCRHRSTRPEAWWSPTPAWAGTPSRSPAGIRSPPTSHSLLAEPTPAPPLTSFCWPRSVRARR